MRDHTRPALVLLAAILAACAAPPPAPGKASLSGTVRLKPREGVTPPREGSSYSDLRYRDVELVDYRRPGFVVVYLEGDPPGGQVELELSGDAIPAFRPEVAAVGSGGTIVVRNSGPVARVVSAPRAGFLQRVGPGATIEVPAQVAGELGLFVLGRNGARATVFVAPGPFVTASSTGRWELRDLAPGRRWLASWHPRLPGQRTEVELRAGESLEVDLELGVDQLSRRGG